MAQEYLFVYSRLKLLIKEAHKSFNQVERELGYPRNTLKNYKYKKKPSVVVFSKWQIILMFRLNFY